MKTYNNKKYNIITAHYSIRYIVKSLVMKKIGDFLISVLL